MDDTLITNAFSQLLFLYNQQVAIAKKQEYDEQIDEIIMLEKKKTEWMSVINQERLKSADYDDLSAETRDKVIMYSNDLTKLNDRLQTFFEQWYLDNSVLMKQVSIQRKTLQTYGGINYSDVVSYYFDEKK